jgi:PAS domain S-box-containing protein
MADSSGDDLSRADALARLAAIVESSDDAIVSKSLEGVITSWNKGAERIFGYTEAETIGKPITMLIPPDRLNEEPRILARIRAGERVDHFETVRRRKNGELIEVSVTISPVRDEGGRIIGASKIARDVTPQKQVQRELQAAKDAAEAASKAKDHFLNVLSHELRTPLTPVLAALGLLEHGPHPDPAELHEQVRMIRRNVETQARLVDDLLDVTRIARGKIHLHFEVTDANAALRGALSMVQGDADLKSLSVTVALHARSPHVWADPGRLQQMFLNILSNAVKFTPDGGSITIRSSDTHDQNGGFRAEVSDTGVGIDADLLPKLFTAFEQGGQAVTRKFGGLGLGLSIVRSMVELHGGHVTAFSGGTGKGASFIIELPTIPAPADALSPASAAPPVAGASSRRILLVEDHADTRTVMSRLLASFGFRVTTAGTVREALDLSERERFDLLVSDIGLPDGSGTDVMRALRQRQQIKGIALSGFGRDEDLRRSAEAGFLQHLTKPVNFHTLREVLVKLAG